VGGSVGKSSLLNLIAGLTGRPGAVIVEDRIWPPFARELASIARTVGMVFQSFNLVSRMTLAECHLPLRFAEVDRASARRSPNRRWNGSAWALAHQPSGLSGGERRRGTGPRTDPSAQASAGR
jgi:ABC-type lipoprotein export system ATPase subunit